jgi:hypothetical protein
MEDTWVLRFLITVWRMRRHQNAWFRLHHQRDLVLAKQYESEVDSELVKRLIIVGNEPVGLDAPEEQRPTSPPEQANLFHTEQGNDKKS